MMNDNDDDNGSRADEDEVGVYEEVEFARGELRDWLDDLDALANVKTSVFGPALLKANMLVVKHAARAIDRFIDAVETMDEFEAEVARAREATSATATSATATSATATSAASEAVPRKPSHGPN